MSRRDDAAVDHDPLPFRRLVLLGAIGITVTLLSVAWSSHFIRRAAQVGSLQDVGHATDAILGGVLVSRPVPTPAPVADAARAAAQLTGWGWTDASHTTFHLPIEVAMAAIAATYSSTTSALLATKGSR